VGSFSVGIENNGLNEQRLLFMYVLVCSLYLYMRRPFTKSGHEPFKKTAWHFNQLSLKVSSCLNRASGNLFVAVFSELVTAMMREH